MTGRHSLRRRVRVLERALAPPIDAHAIHRAILAEEPYPGAGDRRADRLADAIKDMLERSADVFPNRAREGVGADEF